MTSSSSSRYTVVAILLHWAIAALLLFMIWLGWNMEDNEARFQLHKSIGIASCSSAWHGSCGGA